MCRPQATEQQISELIEALQHRVVLDLRATAPALLPAVTSCLGDGDPRVRVRAAHAASRLAALPSWPIIACRWPFDWRQPPISPASVTRRRRWSWRWARWGCAAPVPSRP